MWPCIVTNFFVIKPTRCTNFTNLFCRSCPKAVCKPVWHIPLLSVQWINYWWWTDELSETCRVSCQNKFVKLVHLVGFIIKTFVRLIAVSGSSNNVLATRTTTATFISDVMFVLDAWLADCSLRHEANLKPVGSSNNRRWVGCCSITWSLVSSLSVFLPGS
jgi:hypothetical protein